MSSSPQTDQLRSCLVKLYTQAFYTGVANGRPESIANYRVARAKADTFGSLAAIALERFLEDCPHDADSAKIDIVLDDHYFRLHAEDSLDLLEKGEVTHVVLSLPPKLPHSTRAASVSRAASITRAASSQATTSHSKDQRRRSSTVQPIPTLLSDKNGSEDNAVAGAKPHSAALGKRKRALSTDPVVSRGKSSSQAQMDPASTLCVTLSDDSTNEDEDTIVAPVPKRATAKSKRSSSVGPKTVKGRAQVLKDAEVISISSDADEDADDEATQRPETRGRPPIKHFARRGNGTELSNQNKNAAFEATQRNRSVELAATKDKTSQVVQETLPRPKSTSRADPYEVPSSDKDLHVKQKRTTPRKAKSRASVVPATPTQRPASTHAGSGGASAKPPSFKPATPAIIPSDAKIISIADTSVSDEAGDSDVSSVRHQTPGSRQANGSGDHSLETCKPLPATEKKNGKRPMQHRINENVRFVSPATGSGNAEEHRAQKLSAAPRFSVANSRGVFPLYPKKVSQPEDTSEASERPFVLQTDTSTSETPHTQKATRRPPSSAPAKVSASNSQAKTAPDTLELIGGIREEIDRKEKEFKAKQREEEESKKASAMVKPKSISPKAVIASLVGKPRAKLAPKKKSKPLPASFLKEPENSDEDMSEIIHPPAGQQGTGERDDEFAADLASSSPMITFTPSFRKLTCSGADFKPVNTLNPKLPKPQAPPPTSSAKFSGYPRNVRKAFSDTESSDEKEAQGDGVQKIFSDPESSGNGSSVEEKEALSDSEASVTSLGPDGERRFHVEELADDGLPKAFKAWQVKYGSIFRHEKDLPYLYIDDGPWEGLIVDGKHAGKYICSYGPPSADLIADMTQKAAPRFSELSEAADTSLGEEEDDDDEVDAEVTLPPINTRPQATPPSKWSEEVHTREHFERECPPSNQELGMLMSSSPLRKKALERQTLLLAQTPSQRTRSKTVNWEEELNVTPDTERAMSLVETPQTKSRVSALKNATIVVEITEPSEAQRAQYKKMPEVNAQVLASAPRSLGDINAKSEHLATVSQESDLAVVDYVMNESAGWLKTVDLTDFQPNATEKMVGKRRGSMLKLASETPSRPSTQPAKSSQLKRKGPLYDSYEQADTALLGLSSSALSEGLNSSHADEPRKALRSHVQDSPTKHLTRSSMLQSPANTNKRKVTSFEKLQDSTLPDESSADGPEDLAWQIRDDAAGALKSHMQDPPTKHFTCSSALQSAADPRKRKATSLEVPQESTSPEYASGDELENPDDVAADPPRKAPKSHAHDTPRHGPVRNQVNPPKSTNKPMQPPKASKNKHESNRGGGAGTQVTRQEGDDAQGLDQAQEKDAQKAQRKREKRKRYRARKKMQETKCQMSIASGIGGAPSKKQGKNAGKSLATPPNSSRPSSAGYAV